MQGFSRTALGAGTLGSVSTLQTLLDTAAYARRVRANQTRTALLAPHKRCAQTAVCAGIGEPGAAGCEQQFRPHHQRKESSRVGFTKMGVLTSWVYPLQGIMYLSSSPRLLSIIVLFLAKVIAVSAASAAVWAYLAWGVHMNIIGSLFGVGLLSKFVTSMALLVESAFPVYLMFHRQFHSMQYKLFDATLKMKGVTIDPLQPQDRQTLEGLLAQHQKQQVEQQKWQKRKSSTISGIVSLLGTRGMDYAVRMLLKPQPREGLVMRKSRDLITLGATVFLPFLVPLIAVRDSHAEAASLLSRYLEKKGVGTVAGQNLVAEHLQWELRGFGVVAASLAYIPLLNWFLGLSNMVGAALLAADLERRQTPLIQRDAKA